MAPAYGVVVALMGALKSGERTYRLILHTRERLRYGERLQSHGGLHGPRTHETMVTEPHVQVWQRKLEEWIDNIEMG